MSCSLLVLTLRPVEVDNTLVYFIARPLTPPSDPLSTAFPSLHLSTFLAAIFTTTLAEKLKTMPRTTFLIPHNSAFKRLGSLVSAHLTTNSKSDLESVIRHHIISGVEYRSSVVDGSQRTYGTIEGSDLHIERNSKDNTTLLTASGGWADMHSTLFANNTLTQTGVIHEVSDIMIPRSVNITVGKLMRAAKGTTMLSLVSKAGMDWVLNGTAPPEGSRWADMGLGEAGWTLLCPTDDGFKGQNLTAIYEDTDWIQDIVTQHLIPVQPPSKSPPTHDLFSTLNDNRPLVMDNSATYTTLLTQVKQEAVGDLVFRELEGQGTVVGIKGARGADGRDDWASVMAWGRATTNGGQGGVVQIDRVLMPYHPGWWARVGFPSTVGAFGGVLILAFFWGVRWVWKRDTSEATFEPIGGFERSEDEEEVARGT